MSTVDASHRAHRRAAPPPRHRRRAPTARPHTTIHPPPRRAAGSLHRVLPGVLSTHAGPYDVVAARAGALPVASPAPCSRTPARPRTGASAGRRRTASRSPFPTATAVVGPRAVVHYSNRLPDHHVVELVDGARVTSVARTVFDLGGVLDERGHLSVIEDVRNKGLCTDAELGEVYDDLCGRGRRGSAAWQRLADAHRAGRPPDDVGARARAPGGARRRGSAAGGAAAPGRAAERPHRLPRPRLPGLRVSTSRSITREWHATPTAVEQDKARDLGLAAARLGAAPLHRPSDRAPAAGLRRDGPRGPRPPPARRTRRLA